MLFVNLIEILGILKEFHIKNNLEYYKKFIKEPGEENIALWNAVQNL